MRWINGSNRLWTTLCALVPLTVTALVLASAPASAARAPTATLVIHHQLQGCHAWSLDGGIDATRLAVTIHRGDSIIVTNEDVMSHKLVETAGPGVTYTRVSLGAPMGAKKVYPPSMLVRMGASSLITFSGPGVYHFTTRPGESSMANLKTVGADNVLRLTVRVG